MELMKKNSSATATTMYLSKYQSTNKFNQNGRKSADLTYSDKPMSKDTPRWNQSASTWRHTSPRYSFSKNERFRTKKYYYSDIIEPEIPTTKSSLSCTFGKDKKKPISQLVLRNAKQKPSPDHYNLKQYQQQTRSPNKGKTFGLGWNKYERVYVQHRKDVYSGHFNEDNPQAIYDVRQVPGNDKRAFSIYGRLKMFTSKMADVTRGNPGAHHQIKERQLGPMVGMNERNFSFGERKDLSAPANDFPGAVYLIPGFCDKFKRTKAKNSPKK